MSYLFESLQLPIHGEDRSLTVYWEDQESMDAIILEARDALQEYVASHNEEVQYVA